MSGSFRMSSFDFLSQIVGGDTPCRVALQPERAGYRLPEKRIAERRQHEPQGALGDMMFLVAHAKLSDQLPDRIQDRVQRVAIAGEDHPCGKSSRAFMVESVERPVHNFADVAFSGAGPFDRLG